jgi:hypothetical protein
MNNNLKKDLNFFAAVGRERGLGAIDFEKSVKRSLMVFVPIFIIALAIVLGSNGVKKATINKLNNDIADMQEELDEAAEKLAQKEELQSDIATFDEAKAAYDETPTLDLNLLSEVSRARPNVVSTEHISYAGLKISLSCTGTEVNAIASYVHNLRDVKDSDGNIAFKEITYSNSMNSESGAVSGSINMELYEQTTTEAVEEAVDETTTVAE